MKSDSIIHSILINKTKEFWQNVYKTKEFWQNNVYKITKTSFTKLSRNAKNCKPYQNHKTAVTGSRNIYIGVR